ncbi:MAG: hypothetical protein SCAL_000152 [Candidatus Syntrophoarchaeum caldarius]|uniref:Restriction endonuclease type IV Mrr domain-containing protein n=1 Tax=Candidatus Syntropharchaeum caldarium TaxID=1838285 RepID=A0A1F2PCV6_9EURY|nr:MAG: hypothetical protein SCAL_000152 [Candidatus Syntrophoarchaeum caldarius]
MGGKKGTKVLEEVFRKAGYRVEDSTDYDFDLIAEQDEKRLLIALKVTDTVTAEEVNHYRNKSDVVDGKILLVTTGTIEDDQQRDSDKLIIWDREKFAREVGMAVITNIEGSDFVIDTERVPKSILTFPIKVDRAEALRIADKNFNVVTGVQLRYIPIWCFEYTFRSVLYGASRPIEFEGEGKIYFNGITGRMLEKSLPENFFERVVEDEAIIEPVEVDDSSLDKTAIDDVIAENSKTVTFDKSSADAIISEQRVFKPAKEDVNIKSYLLYLPIWEIEGNTGFMQVDATSGEEIVDPMDDGVEIF